MIEIFIVEKLPSHGTSSYRDMRLTEVEVCNKDKVALLYLGSPFRILILCILIYYFY